MLQDDLSELRVEQNHCMKGLLIFADTVIRRESVQPNLQLLLWRKEVCVGLHSRCNCQLMPMVYRKKWPTTRTRNTSSSCFLPSTKCIHSIQTSCMKRNHLEMVLGELEWAENGRDIAVSDSWRHQGSTYWTCYQTSSKRTWTSRFTSSSCWWTTTSSEWFKSRWWSSWCSLCFWRTTRSNTTK